MRHLTRTITRRIENMVVSISPEGIFVRRFRRRAKQHGKQVGWNDLWHLAGADKSLNREEAFAKPLPVGWMPQCGEWVWIAPPSAGGRKKLTRCKRGVIVCVLPSVPSMSFVVRCGKSEVTFRHDELRPSPSRQVKRKTGGQKELLAVE